MEKNFIDLAESIRFACDIYVDSNELIQSRKDEVYYYLAIRTILFRIVIGGAVNVKQMNR